MSSQVIRRSVIVLGDDTRHTIYRACLVERLCFERKEKLLLIRYNHQVPMPVLSTAFRGDFVQIANYLESNWTDLCRFIEHTKVSIFNKAHFTSTTVISHTHYIQVICAEDPDVCFWQPFTFIGIWYDRRLGLPRTETPSPSVNMYRYLRQSLAAILQKSWNR